MNASLHTSYTNELNPEVLSGLDFNGGSQEACEKIWFTEGGKFAGSTVGGSLGAKFGQAVSKSACVALKRTSVGRVICVLIGTGGGAWTGATVGEGGGEQIGELLYETTLQ